MKPDPEENAADPIAFIEEFSGIYFLAEELQSGLGAYFSAAEKILHHCGIRMKFQPDNTTALEKNFFSCLFLYSYFRANIPRARRILYVATIQCLRGMVTGCDNLLDDEYKMTLDTDLPETGYKIRSVLDIMVSDRVLFDVLARICGPGTAGMAKMLAAGAASMKTIARSGAQEASEEAGISAILPPADVLKHVHHYKTGILFTCPWDIPACVEENMAANVPELKSALYHIGLGCQILDDMVDMVSDLRQKRHNYLVSLICHGACPAEREKIETLRHLPDQHLTMAGLQARFPETMAAARDTAGAFLEKGLGVLFAPEHRSLIAPCKAFIIERIGANLISGE